MDIGACLPQLVIHSFGCVIRPGDYRTNKFCNPDVVRNS